MSSCSEVCRFSRYHPISLVPRGSTALLDAVGRAINETGERLAKMNEEDRPGLVVFVVMTDGEENSSQEFSKDQIKQMITHQQDTYGWHFTFLGANQDAFAEAGALGIHAAGVANFSPCEVAGSLSSDRRQSGQDAGPAEQRRDGAKRVHRSRA